MLPVCHFTKTFLVCEDKLSVVLKKLGIHYIEDLCQI